MFLNNLLEASIIEPHIFSKIMNIGNDITKIFFEDEKILVSWRWGYKTREGGIWLSRTEHTVDCLLAFLYPRDYFVALDLLKREDLV